MADNKPLSDTEAHERLVAALYALGSAPGETARADTALKAARRALVMLQYGLVAAAEKGDDRIEGVMKPVD